MGVDVQVNETMGPDRSREAAFDVLIIGTGGAGVAAAIQAAEMGVRVAIVERGTLGGTCVNIGCIPSKHLIEAAAHYHAARRGFPGIPDCEPPLDWPDVIAQKDALVNELRQAKYADVLASYPEAALIEGEARILGNGRVRVGKQVHHARRIIIATGTSPWIPPIPGLDRIDTLTSTTAMELAVLPDSMIVLGGSAVGLELGQMFARFGAKVTVVELSPRLLPTEDEAISDALRIHLAEEGIEIYTGMTTTRAEEVDDEVVLHVSHGGASGQLRAKRLLVAAGRRPQTEGLGLADAGVATSAEGFIKVSSAMVTSNRDIYAAGDVTGGPGFVYVAAAGGRVAAENAVKSLAPTFTSDADATEFDASVVPAVTFTSPQVASVGLTEAKAREAGYHVRVSVLDMAQLPRAIVSQDTRGLVKIVAEAASGRVLGIHAVAGNAGDLMGAAALAVRFRLTARDLSGTLHPYLTWAESLRLASQGFTMDIEKLSCCA